MHYAKLTKDMWFGVVALALGFSACAKHFPGSNAPAACVVDVITGGEATCLRLGDGSYRCRGENDGFAFTHGNWPGLTASRPWVAMPSGFNSLRLSPGRTCGLDSERTLWCWGRNGLDLESTNQVEPNPVALRKFGIGIESFDANRENTCVVRDGLVYCMGLHGRLGEVVAISGLPKGIIWVGVGVWLGCAATRSDVYCWGSPAWADPDGSPHAIVKLFGDTTRAVHVGTLPDDFAEGAVSAHAGCVLLRSGKLFCWGSTYSGEWGTGAMTRCESAPCPDYDFRSLHEVATVSGTATHLSGGAASFCVIRNDHSVWCWGSNNCQLVSPRTAYDPERKVVAPLDEPLPVEQKNLGKGNAEVHLGATHGCVKKLDGSIVCWGSNSYRQVTDDKCAGNACPLKTMSFNCAARTPPP